MWTADAAAYNLELRVLVFKLIRELLRNVVKHSGVQSATVTVTQTPKELFVVVEDRGVGFEWQLSLFEARSVGFGLWSVADRVRAASGEMTVDTAPGRGCRVSVVFPHIEVSPLIQQRDSRGGATIRETAAPRPLEGAPRRHDWPRSQKYRDVVRPLLLRDSAGFFARRRDMRSAASRPW